VTLVGWRTAALAAALAAASWSCAIGSIQRIAGSGGGPAGNSSGVGGTGGTGGGQGGCVSAADCPAPSNPCVPATCHAGVCGTEIAPEGTVAALDVPADCQATLCDGTGHAQKGVDLSNVPVSSNPCLMGTCDMTGTPGTAPVAAGATCTSDSGGQRCDGQGNCVQCLDAKDCPAGMSCGELNTCMGSPCMDGVKDGSETDVDCGGAICPPCGTGLMCEQGSDCVSTVCDAVMHTCLSPKCMDGVKDGNETDVDCGGSCSACPLGKACLATQDCVSNACDAVSLTCVASRCVDDQKDGNETDVDCGGGTCPPCAGGKWCLIDSDCASGTCDPSAHVCVVNQCQDGVKDGGETDVDCGGSNCPQCPLGEMCQLDSDCTTNACDGVSFTCDADQCADHRADGAETDVDCGGPDCVARCAGGKHCSVTSDCATGLTCSTTGSHRCM
jgi:hypothetical protein